MPKYLGETPVDISNHDKLKHYQPKDWAMYFIHRYGQIDGDHHKAWVLDQVSRILKGTPIEVKLAKWDDGQQEYRITTLEPSGEYRKWVSELMDGEDGPATYTYDIGVAP